MKIRKSTHNLKLGYPCRQNFKLKYWPILVISYYDSDRLSQNECTGSLVPFQILKMDSPTFITNTEIDSPPFASEHGDSLGPIRILKWILPCWDLSSLSRFRFVLPSPNPTSSILSQTWAVFPNLPTAAKITSIKHASVGEAILFVWVFGNWKFPDASLKSREARDRRRYSRMPDLRRSVD